MPGVEAFIVDAPSAIMPMVPPPARSAIRACERMLTDALTEPGRGLEARGGAAERVRQRLGEDLQFLADFGEFGQRSRSPAGRLHRRTATSGTAKSSLRW